MYIKDLSGNKIEITNLAEAIAQTNLFKDLRHINHSPEIQKSDDEKQAYWRDVHQKLMWLNNKQKSKR